MNSAISLELLLNPEVRRLLNSFAGIMKIHTVFMSRQGKVLERGRDSGNSTYCQLMQERYFGIDACCRQDDKMRRKCIADEEVCCYQCHAGLREIIAPVKVLGEVAGFMMMGQFRTSETAPTFICDDPAALAAFKELPLFNESEVSGLKDMIHLLIEYIVNKELVYYSEGLRYQKIIHYLEQHLAEPVSLKELSAYVNISGSLLSRFLRCKYHTTFKQLLTQKRLEAAEMLWKENPELSVGEVSQQVGYDDQHYFSRVYRKNRGITPGEFKRRH